MDGCAIVQLMDGWLGDGGLDYLRERARAHPGSETLLYVPSDWDVERSALSRKYQGRPSIQSLALRPASGGEPAISNLPHRKMTNTSVTTYSIIRSQVLVNKPGS